MANESNEENNSPFADAPIYYYGGHGSDMCEPTTKRPILDIVPKDCIYITITQCGDKTHLTFEHDKTEENFFRDPATRDILRHPELRVNKRVIADALHVDVTSVHVHLPGQPYVRSYLSPFSYWFNPEHSAIAISGLIEKEKLEELNRQADPLKPLVKKRTTFIRHGMKGNRLFALLSRLYGSDPETIEYLKQCMDRLVDYKKQATGRGGLTRDTLLFRQKDANYITSQIDFSIPKEKLVDFFSASVHPTPDAIVHILTRDYIGQTKIFGGQLPEIAYKLEEYLEANSNVNTPKFSNAYMMKHFPGIHYNVVCRDVMPSCIVSLQRSMSSGQEMERVTGRSPHYTLNNDEFQGLMQNLSNTTNKRYRYFAAKKRAVKNLLLSRSEYLLNANNSQRKNLMNFLTRKKIITNNNAQPISKTIKYIIDPSKYAAYVTGGTRKRRR